MKATITLKEFAGQYCDVEINKRTNNSVYITFKSQTGFGYPTLEEGDLEVLNRKVKQIKED